MGLGRGAALAGAVLAGGAVVPALAAGQSQPVWDLRVASFRAPSAIVIGERAAISGQVAPRAAVPVMIERLEGATWTPLVTLRSGRDGRFSAKLPLRVPGSLRATLQAPDGTLVTSRRRNVAVRRKVALRVRAIEYQQIAGHLFTATGHLRPAVQGETAVLEGAVGKGRFRPLAQMAVRSGKFRARFRPPRGGRWRFRVAVAPRPAIDSGGWASAAAMTVAGLNPHGVPASAPHYLVQKIGEMSLYYYQRGKLVRLFPVVFGAPSTPTPVGSFRVYSKTAGPSAAFGPLVLWYHRGYGIHGTNQEYLLGRSWRYYSHGCTRNYNKNILWLWGRIPVGTPVKNLY
jgi:lipoprotein-anchoring transpeptidase ErfK/SrfK